MADVLDILNPNPPLTHRFGVFFFAAGVVPNPIDIRFQRVSGLSAEITTEPVDEGGQNLYTHRLPKKISYNNLVLERGLMQLSPLNNQFIATFSFYQFLPSNVLVTLFSELNLPLAGWLFMNAYPVRWSVADLDATANAVAIETMELAYTRFQLLKI